MSSPTRALALAACLFAVPPALAQQLNPISACRADLNTLCKDVSGIGARLQCLKANQDNLSPECIGSIRAILGEVQGKAATAAASPHAPRPLKACQQEIASICTDLRAGEGGQIRCLRDNRAKLGPACAEALDGARTRAQETRKLCEADRQRLCPDAKGAGEQMRCLRERQADLTGECRELVSAVKAARSSAAPATAKTDSKDAATPPVPGRAPAARSASPPVSLPQTAPVAAPATAPPATGTPGPKN